MQISNPNGWPVNLMPAPTMSLYGDDMFTNTWQSNLGFDALGNGNFDIPATGGTSTGGLRVFFQGSLAGAAGAGWQARVTRVSGANVTLTFSNTNKLVTVGIPTNGTLGPIATAIAAESRLASRYYDDGDAGNTAALVSTREVRDGHAPRDCIIRIQKNNTGLVYVGPTAPDANIDIDTDHGVDGVVLMRSGDTPFYIAVPAGSRLWHRRHGTANFDASMELWK